MNPSTESSVQASIDDLKALVRDAEQALAGAGDEAGEKFSELRERMRAALEDTRSRFENVREATREKLDEADEYVRGHPYQSIGLAAAVGVLIGVLVSRRSA